MTEGLYFYYVTMDAKPCFRVMAATEAEAYENAERMMNSLKTHDNTCLLMDWFATSGPVVITKANQAQ